MSDFLGTITHWTGGGGRASQKDKEHYHTITEFDGRVVNGKHDEEDNIVTSDGDYAAHTRNLNTRYIGKAMAGMRGATEYPLHFGPSPITRVQFEAHCRELAKTHIAYGMPVTDRTCLTHAEVEPTLGVKQNGKWDITVLEFEPNIRGAIPVGNYMRERVRSYMGMDQGLTQTYPTLRVGSRGKFVEELQSMLHSAGHFTGRQDGQFGPLTRNSVMSFQAQNGLLVDGIAGQQTWFALMKAGKPEERDVSAEDLRESGSRTIKSGDNLQTIALGGGGLAAGSTAVNAIRDVTSQLQEASSVFDSAREIIVDNWQMIAFIVIAFLVWRYASKIKKARVEDARTGRNLAR